MKAMRTMGAWRLGDAGSSGTLQVCPETVRFVADDGTATTFERDSTLDIVVDGSVLLLRGTQGEGRFISAQTNDELQRRRWAQSLAHELQPSNHSFASPDVSFDAFTESMNQPGSGNSSKVWMLVSLAAFLALGDRSAGLQTLVILSCVLLFHEGGHALAMAAFGYRDLAVFFLPFVGAVTTGRAVGVLAWKRAFVILAGPLPGLALACVLLWGTPSDVKAQPWFASTIGLLFVVNAFNLLPLGPLDGGKFISLLLLPLSPRAETAVGIGSGLVLMCVLGLAQQWVLLAVVGLFVWSTFLNRRIPSEGLALRSQFQGASAVFSELPVALQQALYDRAGILAMRSLDSSGATRPKALLKQMTTIGRTLLDRATADRPGLWARVVLLFVYCLALVPVVAMVALYLSRMAK